MTHRPDTSVELSWIRRGLAPDEELWHFACGGLMTGVAGLGKDLLSFARRMDREVNQELRREGVAKTLAKVAAVVVVDSIFIEDASTSSSDLFFRRDRDQPEVRAGAAPPMELAGCAIGLTPRRLVVIGTGSRTWDGGRVERAPLWMATFLPHQIGPTTAHVRRRKLGPLEGLTLVLGEGEDALEFSFGWPEDIAQVKAIARRLDARNTPR